MTDLNAIILKHFPLAGDCVKGHKGVLVWTIQNEQIDDDRQQEIKVERCSHCWMPTGKSEPYRGEKDE